jgi:hypothetical protein
MRRLLPLVLVAACAHASPPPGRPWEPALARFQIGRPLAGFFPPGLLELDARALGAVGDLVPLPGGTLGFIERGCEVTEGCGCAVGSEYRYGRDGDRIVIAHLVPDLEIKRVVHPGSCGTGCGVREAEQRDLVRDLGPIAAAQVERVDVHYKLVRTEVTCELPVPMQ